MSKYIPKIDLPKGTSAWILPGLLSSAKPDSGPELIAWMYGYLKRVCIHYEVPISEILGISRKREYVYVRQMFCYWMKKTHPDINLVDIARLLLKDHTSVIYSINTFQGLLDSNADSPLFMLYRRGKIDIKCLDKVRDDYSNALKTLQR